MDCQEVRSELDALLDRELEGEIRARVEAHTADCGECRAELAKLGSLGTALRSSLPVKTPAGMDAKVLEAMSSAARPQEFEPDRRSAGIFAFPRLVFAGGLLALAVCTGLGFQIGRMSANAAAADIGAGNEFSPPIRTRTVEVPVVSEKIVEVPVYRDRVVTRTVYVTRSAERNDEAGPSSTELAMKSAVRNNEFLTQTDLAGFVPVSELKLNVTKKDEEK